MHAPCDKSCRKFTSASVSRRNEGTESNHVQALGLTFFGGTGAIAENTLKHIQLKSISGLEHW